MLVPNAQDTPDIKQAGPIIWNYFKMDGAQSTVLRMPFAPFVILLSPVVVRLGRLLILLVERFSVKK
jgi:hypothetical protein